jgi:hypothetical protein
MWWRARSNNFAGYEKGASPEAGPVHVGKEKITQFSATEVDPGINQLERASSGRPLVLLLG